MKKIKILFLSMLFLVLSVSMASADPYLFDYAFNADGDFYGYGDPLSGDFDDSAFNWDTGIGTLTWTTDTVGDHYFLAFFDHEFTWDVNTFYNEEGFAFNSPEAGQSWEIDEPGYYNGDIYENFQVNMLDNGIGTSVYGDTIFPDDVSMAMGWDFSLAADQTATIYLMLGLQDPGAGFYLLQYDSFSEESLYFSSSLDIRGGGEPPPVPEPATMLLLGSGLAGLFGFRKRFGKK